MSDTFDHELDAFESRDNGNHDGWSRSTSYYRPYYKPKKKKMQYMTEEIDWNATLPGATHALKSSNGGYWYYWKVVNGITHWNDEGEWRRHSNQEDSKNNLAYREKVTRNKVNYENTPYEEKPQQTERTTMNLNNAALLVRDDVNTVSVLFDGTTKAYTYVLHESIEATEGDKVVVYANGSMKVATVSEVHETPQIDPNFNMDYGWIYSNIEPSVLHIVEQKATTDRIAEKLKQQQSRSVRDQILAQFGVTNVKEFLALDSK